MKEQQNGITYEFNLHITLSQVNNYSVDLLLVVAYIAAVCTHDSSVLQQRCLAATVLEM